MRELHPHPPPAIKTLGLRTLRNPRVFPASMSLPPSQSIRRSRLPSVAAIEPRGESGGPRAPLRACAAAIFLRGFRRTAMEPGGGRREKLPPPLPPPAPPGKAKEGPPGSSRGEKAKQRAAQQELKQRQRAEIYALNRVMTELEQQQFDAFCKQMRASDD